MKKATMPTKKQIETVVIELKKHPYEIEKLSMWVANNGMPFCPCTPCSWCRTLFRQDCPCCTLGYTTVAKVVKRLLKAVARPSA